MSNSKAIFVTLLCPLVLLLSACHSTPDQTKYIPKDASLVVGINTVSLGKKIAWNAFWGSKLLDEMKKNIGKEDVIKNVENTGIKTLTTYYLYMKTDARYMGQKKFFAIIPLDDADKWKTYLKTVVSDVVINENKGRNEAWANKDIYMAWTGDVLMMSNVIYKPEDNIESGMSDSAAYANTVSASTVDTLATQLEMDKAFNLAASDGVTNQKSFAELTNEGHDIVMWVNYESLANDYVNPTVTGGINLSDAFWKGAAMSMGFDFEKGKIAGVVHHYIGQEMIDACADFGKQGVDKELIEKLPSRELNLLAGWNIAPNGVKRMMEKLALNGLANAGLNTMGTNLDDVLDAFNGSMGIALNNFSVRNRVIPANSMYEGQEPFNVSDANIDYTFVMKIGKKAAFDKLFNYAKSENMIQQNSSDTYIIPGTTDSVYIGKDDKFMVISNSMNNVSNYLSGVYSKELKNAAVIKPMSHPMGVYFDITSMINKADTTIANGEYLGLTKNLLSSLVFYGGDNKKNTFEYNISVDFVNKEENSLIQLLDFASKVQKKATEGNVASN